MVHHHAYDIDYSESANRTVAAFVVHHSDLTEYLASWQLAVASRGSKIATLIMAPTSRAHFALVPIKVLYNGKAYKSALSVFNAVDENHRNLYLFYQLASKSFEIAKLENIKFVMSVASEASSKLYVKCFKFKLISPLKVQIGLSKFQEKNNQPHKFEVLRDKTTLKWRLNNPRFKYQIYKENHRSIIFNNNYKLFKMNMGYVNNKEVDPLNEIISKSTFNLNPINIWMGLNNNLKNINMSFDFPEILKPSPSNFIIKDLKSKETNLSKEDIKFNLIDYEVF